MVLQVEKFSVNLNSVEHSRDIAALTVLIVENICLCLTQLHVMNCVSVSMSMNWTGHIW